jgi:hypothetical protein
MRNALIAPAAACLLLGSSIPAVHAQTHYGWSISNSATDPQSNSGAIGEGPSMFEGRLYLWLLCTPGGGASAARLGFEEDAGGGLPYGFVSDTVMHQGFVIDLQLTFPACTTGPYLVGALQVTPDWLLPAISVCLAPSLPDGFNVTWDCSPTPQAWPNECIGFVKNAASPCPGPICDTTALERNSWGRLKALYR